MISPSKQQIIQIDITNACPHKCGNCTRFVGHHPKPSFMSFEQFKQAVDSLKDFPGMVGVIGGEPTLHPEFDKFVKYMNSVLPCDPVTPERLKPIKDFSAYRTKHLWSNKKKKGIFTSLGPGYAKHYELIQDTFAYQCINDHSHGGEHMALLLPYTELGIDRETFLKYRDDCWLQREWSAGITPKGAFFCEMAGSLDKLFNGPGGWPVEPGWWKRTPDQFGDQLKWCEVCSACLPVPRAKATDGYDIVSPKMAEFFRSIGSKKPIKVFDPKDYAQDRYIVNHVVEPYLPTEGNIARIAPTNDSIKPKRIDVIIVCENYDDYLSLTLKRNIGLVDSITVVTSEADVATQAVAKASGAQVFFAPRLHENGAVFAKGKAINDALAALKPEDWVLFLDADVILPPVFPALKEYVLNPGALYYTRRWGPVDLERLSAFLGEIDTLSRAELFETYGPTKYAQMTGRTMNAMHADPWGYFQLINLRAASLPSPVYPETSGTAEWDDNFFGHRVYPVEKQVCLPIPEFDVIHLPHGMAQENWNGRRSPRIEDVLRSPEKYKAVSTVFECVNKCYFRGRVFNPGETIVASRGEFVPRHFVRRG